MFRSVRNLQGEPRLQDRVQKTGRKKNSWTTLHSSIAAESCSPVLAPLLSTDTSTAFGTTTPGTSTATAHGHPKDTTGQLFIYSYIYKLMQRLVLAPYPYQHCHSPATATASSGSPSRTSTAAAVQALAEKCCDVQPVMSQMDNSSPVDAEVLGAGPVLYI